jgi:NADPH:quinone reductase-like Zn-dependent oxidoreductase
VRSGQDVLVNGATGAIGSAAVQLLANLRVRVTAVCDGSGVELVRGLGAGKVVDYMVEDFTTDDLRYDIVFDAVGKSTFGRCRRLLKPGGVYVSSELGPLFQNAVLSLVTPLVGRFIDRTKVVFPFPSIDQAMVRQFAQLMESGAFRPIIDRRYPLDDIVKAYRYVETGRKLGNVVIVVDHAR